MLKMNRKFPEFTYDIYGLNKKELEEYINIWLEGRIIKDKFGNILSDEMWTVKKVDQPTSFHLYNRIFNPISIKFLCVTDKQDDKFIIKPNIFNLKAQIHSIDDTSYGMWKYDITMEEAQSLRTMLMKYLNEKKEVNGNDWLLFGKNNNFTNFEI